MYDAWGDGVPFWTWWSNVQCMMVVDGFRCLKKGTTPTSFTSGIAGIVLLWYGRSVVFCCISTC